ncbi:MAG TPA: winged helix-turn-helix domain-containing protein [Candidatus Nanoarchaeia archaeon]|nr:winged helix-turn-helix domain-containing protein [Candidatus Nanoarchaeia archaeon]
MVERRNKVETVIDILEVLQQRGKLKTTHILYKSNLSHTKLKVLLEELLEKKLIVEEVDGKTRFYHLTDTGGKFLQQYVHMKKFTDSFGF